MRARRVLLDSFISTQKLSVQKTLARKFARFVAGRRSHAELLLGALQQLLREQRRFDAAPGAPPPPEDGLVHVPIKCAPKTLQPKP